MNIMTTAVGEENLRKLHKTIAHKVMFTVTFLTEMTEKYLLVGWAWGFGNLPYYKELESGRAY